MTNQIPATQFTSPVSAHVLERTADALEAHGFTVDILDDAGAARARVNDLIPEGVSVLTAASEALRLSGIDDDLNASGRYEAVRPRILGHGPRHRRPQAAATDSSPPLRRGQRQCGHRIRFPGSRFGQREPTSRLLRRCRPSSLGGRSAEDRCPTWSRPCDASKTTPSRWKPPAPSRLTGCPAPSTVCSF